MSQYLYCDGGVIGKNPSPLGGTWACCLIADGNVFTKQSGVITCHGSGLPAITNNFMELYAALKALKLVENFCGTLFTDSRVTLCRLLDGESFEGIPAFMRQAVLELRRGRRWEARLVAGHPTQEDLKRGRKKNGALVSKWNVYVDKMCQREAERFMRKRART